MFISMYCRVVGKGLDPSAKSDKTYRTVETVPFKALYYQGEIIGFKYNTDNEINYVLPEYGNIN